MCLVEWYVMYVTWCGYIYTRLLRGVVEVYRREQWWKTLSSVLQTLLRCAYLLGHLQDYFLFSMELISYCIPLPTPLSPLPSPLFTLPPYKLTHTLQRSMLALKVAFCFHGPIAVQE